MSKIDRQQIFEKYNGHCAYCGKVLPNIKEMQVDHIHPKALYNMEVEKVVNNTPEFKDSDREENLNPSCRRCNHYKRAETLESFRSSIKTIQDRLMKIYIFKVAVDFGIVKIKPFNGIFYFETKKP